ncbi:hypothetical protein LUZ60_017014 [Juncus effusus]|nr:hypothetical protein LUZ60_017014 [Juncus effusus]
MDIVSSLLFLLSLLPLCSSSILHLHKLRLTTPRLLDSTPNSDSHSPTTFFEVTRPIPLPETPSFSLLLLQHDFAYTYSKPPVTSHYTPPSFLNDPSNPPRIVLEWTATCKGRQFDRIFGVWFAGVEILRGCTAEPRPNGIVWSVRKDITKYSSLFYQNSTLAVFLANIADSTYTGIYHVNISVHFYFESSRLNKKLNLNLPAFDSPADLILPISRNLPLNDGLWFLIQNSTDIQSKKLIIPLNTYRAVIEVYISFHQDDEFWYTNPPNDYIYENNLTGTPGNGAFREVRVSLDGDLVGAIWPFTVIYTGGVNPLLWRPITGIGSFNLPSYNIEITPFLGKLLDGNPHKFGFGVTNALDVWFVDANLHLWLDPKSSKTKGSLISYKTSELKLGLNSKFKGLDGKFVINANRSISSYGWVESSYGKITTNFSQDLHYQNFIEFSNCGNAQLVRQTIQSTYTTYAKSSDSVVYTEEMQQTFPLYLYNAIADQIYDRYSLVSNLSLGFNQKQVIGDKLGLGFGFGSLTNLQNGQGEMKVKGNLVTSGLGSTQEVYKYEGTDGCYFRNVSSSNYTILFDISVDSCQKLFAIEEPLLQNVILEGDKFEE